MRFVRFEAKGEEPQLGILADLGREVVPVSAIDKTLPASDLCELIDALDGRGVSSLVLPEKPARSYALADVRLLAPIGRPRHDILCLGVNYADHLAETKRGLGNGDFEAPPAAIYFSKRASRILGPDDAIEARLDLDECLDYEVELAVVIGKGGHRIPLSEAESHIFGYSVFNDISSRGLQKGHGQWFMGKSVDTYAAMGPEVVTTDELPFPLELDVSSHVNGELRQNSNTRLLIHGVAETIAELSDAMTLEAGDIIAMGTPAGVGMGFVPPRWLKRGDSVTCQIAEIGALTNTVA